MGLDSGLDVSDGVDSALLVRTDIACTVTIRTVAGEVCHGEQERGGGGIIVVERRDGRLAGEGIYQPLSALSAVLLVRRKSGFDAPWQRAA
jgi:hypothetical protein